MHAFNIINPSYPKNNSFCSLGWKKIRPSLSLLSCVWFWWSVCHFLLWSCVYIDVKLVLWCLVSPTSVMNLLVIMMSYIISLPLI